MEGECRRERGRHRGGEVKGWEWRVMEGEERREYKGRKMGVVVGVWRVMMRVGEGEGDARGEKEGEVDGEGEGQGVSAMERVGGRDVRGWRLVREGG